MCHHVGARLSMLSMLILAEVFEVVFVYFRGCINFAWLERQL